MNEHPADVMREIAARMAFLEAAALAVSIGTGFDSPPDSAAWEGLFYFAQDIRLRLKDAATEAEKAA